MSINILSENFFKYRESILTHILLISLLFFMVVADLSSALQNARYIFSLQLIFCVAYLLTFKKPNVIKELINSNKYGSGLLVAWVISVLLSFIYSMPFGDEFTASMTRMLQSFMHIFFFLTCWHLFLTKKINLKLIFYVIAITSIIVMFAYLIHGYLFPYQSSSEWMNDPPFNSHIRHAGYQVVASICLILGLLIEKSPSQVEQWFKFTLLILLFAFLFWLGGRGAIMSVYITVLFYVSVLIYRGRGKGIFSFLASVFLVSILGMLISEYFVLFSWNGFSGAIFRSSDRDSINALSSGRIDIWMNALDMYKNHILWGLGPQGFLKVPTSHYIVQPHNVLIQFLIEWGLVGTLIFLTLLIKGFYFGVKKYILEVERALNVYALGAGGVIVALSIHALFDGTYYHPQPSLYLAFCFALWVQPNGLKKTHGIT